MQSKEFVSIEEAAKIFNKSIHNISYLVQYNRINKYYRLNDGKILMAKEIKKNKNKNVIIVVSLKELNNYYKEIKKQQEEIIRNIPNCNTDLLFFDIPEKERTKHVHRLHPYMGKFIPQLVEYYLNKYFHSGNIILDPFMGSGTTLVEANIKNMKVIGIDISEFNCMIASAKIESYDLDLLEKEINDILIKTKIEYKNLNSKSTLDKFLKLDNSQNNINSYKTDNKYLNKWFASETLKQILIYHSFIPKYTYQNILKIILSRSMRSARLTFHFELTRLKEPIYEPYVCHKHRNKICAPAQSLIEFLERYSRDTIQRIKEFSKIRSKQPYVIINADSRKVNLKDYLLKYFDGELIDGIITSPPYLGLINYHHQHIYAYEIFNIKKRTENEIGRKDLGTNNAAKEKYTNDIAAVFKNMKKFLKENAKVFVVANDKWNLYPKIAKLAGYEIIHRDERPVTRKASRERTFYSESIFYFKPIF
ncbi:MAG: DNA methyltransferase [Promethearchaeota archaeon]